RSKRDWSSDVCSSDLVLGMISVPLMNKYLSKSKIWALSLALAVIGQFIIMFAHLNLPVTVIGWIIANIGSGIACSLPFALLGSRSEERRVGKECSCVV